MTIATLAASLLSALYQIGPSPVAGMPPLHRSKHRAPLRSPYRIPPRDKPMAPLGKHAGRLKKGKPLWRK